MILRFTAVWTLVCWLSGCRSEKELIKPSAEINQLIGSSSVLPPPPAEGTVLLSDDPASPQLINGTSYTARKQTFRQTKRFATHVNAAGFDQRDPNNTQGLYVGSILRLKPFAQQGDLTSIGVTAREPINLTSTLPGAVAKTLLPGKSAYQTALTEWTKPATSMSAAFSYEATTMHSTEQALLEQGINLGWGPVSLSTKFSASTSFEQQDLLIAFRQVQHTVSMEYPGSAAGFFAASVDVGALRASADDPLGYVSEISYGRILLARFRFSSSLTTDKTQVATSLLTAIKSGFTFDTALKSQLSTSNVQLTVLGGDAASAAKIVTATGLNALNSIQVWINDGANTSVKAAPLSYKIRYLSDNSPVMLGSSTEYTEFSNFRLAKPKQFAISKLTISRLPLLDAAGNLWDPGVAGWPDVYFTLTDAKGESIFALKASERKENVTEAELLAGTVSWDLTKYGITADPQNTLLFRLWDYDSFDTDDEMGVASFNPVGIFPQRQVEALSKDGKIRLVLTLDWQ